MSLAKRFSTVLFLISQQIIDSEPTRLNKEGSATAIELKPQIAAISSSSAMYISTLSNTNFQYLENVRYTLGGMTTSSNHWFKPSHLYCYDQNKAKRIPKEEIWFLYILDA